MRVNKILDSNTRCPYCGNLAILPGKLHNFGAPHQKCAVCGNEYTFQYNIGIEMLWFWLGWVTIRIAFSLIEFYNISIFILLLPILLWSIFYPPFWMHYPLKPIEEIRWGLCSSYDTEIEIAPEYKAYFKKNMIYPICFFDDNNHSVSKYCCVKVKEIKKRSGKHCCVIETLPYGEKIDENMLDHNFNIFFDKKIIGTGRIV